MNRNRTQTFFVRPNTHHPLVVACAAGLLTLGFASGAWAGSVPAGVIGGQGGATGSSLGGAAGNGGQGGGGGAAGTIGTAGNGGGGGATGQSGGGSGGTVGLNATVSSTVTGATGNAGSVGGDSAYYSGGGGGGGGGDGVYSAAGVTITHPASSTIIAGNGGNGGIAPFYYGGSGGGGGNGIEFAAGGTLVNQGVIIGGAGGSIGATYSPYTSFPSGSGGGHGVVGAGITIRNSGTIAGGPAGVFGAGPTGAAGTSGDAILFTGGANSLLLETGFTISGNIELASGAGAAVQPQNSSLTLSSAIVLDDNTTSVSFDTTPAGLTVSGVMSGGGSMAVSGVTTNPLILSSANTFTGGSTVNSGDLQVDGGIGAVIITGGVLNGIGTVGNITANAGSVAPGESSQRFGTLTSSGTADLAAGSTLAIRTTDGTACSALHAIGALTLGGTLNIHFENTPTIGTTCTIATASSVSGTFANVVSAPATVTVSYNSNDIQFTVTGNSDIIFADGFDGGP